MIPAPTRAIALAAACALALLTPARSSAQGAGGAQDPEGVALLEAAAERYRSMDTMCADFEQSLVNTLLADDRLSRGRLCQRRPNLFRMDFSDPEGDEVLSDGRYFHLYYPSMNPGQVVRIPLDPERGGLDFQREFLGNPVERWQVSLEGGERIAGHDTRRLHLVPRQAGETLDAWLWIDPVDHLVRRVRLYSRNGVQRTVQLEDIEFEPRLPSDYFEFQLPAGARVIDAPGARGAAAPGNES